MHTWTSIRQLLGLLLTAVAVPGQGSEPRRPATVSEVTTVDDPLGLTTPRPQQAGMVVTVGGTLVTALREAPAKAPPAGDASAAHLSLWSSADGGASWQERLRLPGGMPTHGVALGADPVADHVHVAWAAGEPANAAAVWYGRWSPGDDAWHEQPGEIVPNAKPGAPFLVEDLAVAANGTVVVAVSSYRSPQPPWASWQGAILVRDAGAKKFGEPVTVNRGGTGISVGLAIHDGTVHTTYRAHGSVAEFGVHYRRYSLATDQWIDDADLPVFAAGDAGQTTNSQTTNSSSLLVTDRGDVYVLYPRARDRDHGQNGLRLAYLPTGADPSDRAAWRRQTIHGDRGLRGGNYNPPHFTLSRGPGNHVHALYSLVEDRHASLLLQTFVDGAAGGNTRTLAQAPPGSFRTVSGVTDPRAHGLLYGMAAGHRTAAAFAAHWPVPHRLLGDR